MSIKDHIERCAREIEQFKDQIIQMRGDPDRADQTRTWSCQHRFAALSCALRVSLTSLRMLVAVADFHFSRVCPRRACLWSCHRGIFGTVTLSVLVLLHCVVPEVGAQMKIAPTKLKMINRRVLRGYAVVSLLLSWQCCIARAQY